MMVNGLGGKYHEISPKGFISSMFRLVNFRIQQVTTFTLWELNMEMGKSSNYIGDCP
jgi:hypothetical protein